MAPCRSVRSAASGAPEMPQTADRKRRLPWALRKRCQAAAHSRGGWSGRSLPFSLLQPCSPPPASSGQSLTGAGFTAKMWSTALQPRITEQGVEGWVWSGEKTASCLPRYKLGQIGNAISPSHPHLCRGSAALSWLLSLLVSCGGGGEGSLEVSQLQ